MSMKDMAYRLMAGSLQPIVKLQTPQLSSSVTIFMFHAIHEDHSPHLICPSSRSRASLLSAIESIQRRFPIVSLDDALNCLDATDKSPRAVLTFDDSLRVSAELTAPLLSEMGIPATFYLSTDVLDSGTHYWWHRVEYVLTYGSGEVTLEIAGVNISLSGGCDQALVKKQLKLVTAQERDEAITRIEEALGAALTDGQHPYPCADVMTWDQARQIRDLGLTIGSHSLSHDNLARVQAEPLRRELKDSKSRIEEMLDISCDHFCYPYGFHDSGTREAVLEAGCASALTCDTPGWNPPGYDRLSLRRVSLHPTAWKAGYQVGGEHDLIYRIGQLAP